MTGFFLRALGLATLIYFVFVLPIGRKTLAQEAMEVWEQTHMRQILEVKGARIRHELTLKLQRWQKTHALKGDIDADGSLADDIDRREAYTADDFDAPPVPRPKAPKTNRPKNARGRPGKEQVRPIDDNHS